MKTVQERVKYLPLLVGHYVKTPSTAGGMWFSYTVDNAITDHERVEIESIGIYRGVEKLRKRLEDGPDGKRRYEHFEKAIVDFSYRDLNNSCEMFEAKEIIPILRPLESITDKECLELARAEGFDEKIIIHRPEAVIANIRTIFQWKKNELMLSPTMSLWLALNAFDITAAIEKGLALNKLKTKLPIDGTHTQERTTGNPGTN